MSSNDRLAELRRQRAQIQDHLAWLDGEIAAEEKRIPSERVTGPIGGAAAGAPVGTPAAGPASKRAVSSAPAQPAHSSAPAVVPAAPRSGTGSATGAAGPTDETDAVLAEYRTPPADLQKDVRNGCLLYFAAAVLILAGIVAALYYALRR